MLKAGRKFDWNNMITKIKNLFRQSFPNELSDFSSLGASGNCKARDYIDHFGRIRILFRFVSIILFQLCFSYQTYF